MKEIEVTCKLGKELSADEIQTAAKPFHCRNEQPH